MIASTLVFRLDQAVVQYTCAQQSSPIRLLIVGQLNVTSATICDCCYILVVIVSVLCFRLSTKAGEFTQLRIALLGHLASVSPWINSDNPPSVIQQLSVVGGADTLKKAMASIFQDRKCIQLTTTVVAHSYTFLPFIADASDEVIRLSLLLHVPVLYMGCPTIHPPLRVSPPLFLQSYCLVSNNMLTVKTDKGEWFIIIADSLVAAVWYSGS